MLLLGAAAVGHAEVIVTLGASSGSSSSCNLSGGGTCNLSARVTGLSQASVTFDFSPGLFGGSLGNPTGPNPTGLTTITYTAPNPVLSRQTITVTVRAVDGTSASTVITLVPPTVTVQVSPATVTLASGATQHFSATVFGVSQTGVTWSYSPQVGTISVSGNSIDYTAPSPITATQTITITATSNFDPTVSGTAKVQLNTPTITISPASVTLTNSQTAQFTATLTNTTTNDVTWSLSPQVGTIDANGLYMAPSLLTVAQKVTVTATSVSDPNKTATATINLTPLILVGAGAPTEAMTSVFQASYNRNGFNALVVMPPVGNVKAFGTSGYVQEFTDAANSLLKDALVTGAASLGGTNAVFQIMGPLYAYYVSVGPNTAGYPLGDSQPCSAQDVSCVWDTFDKNYALFAYTSTLTNGQNFNVNGTFFTEWTARGGFATFGSPVSAPTAVTAAVIAPATAGTTASVQTFAKGAIYSITSGTNRNKIFGVSQPMYDLYTSQQGPLGPLGLPTSELYQVSAGVYKQNFEGGALQYSGSGDPTVLLPVASVRLGGVQQGSSITLNFGQTMTLTATPIITNGTEAPDRPVTWSSTNAKVISIQATGGTAVVTAAGAGAASVQAASQGISSARINFIVIAPCCQVGDGAPATVQQAFQDALSRNKIVAQFPLPAPAARVGAGYVQMVQASDSTAVYMLAQSDRLGTAYVVSGAILARYQALGGPAGTLGYPASDVSGGGTQLFANGAALGGNPVRLVTNPILAKWALLGYESGAAGFPSAEATTFATLGANAGQEQAFTKGVIYGATSGPRAGQSYFVSGAILARYQALGGASGDFGMPVSDEFGNGGLRQQNFEGGNITWGGSGAAVEHASPRTPGVIASPASVSAGGRARLAVTGFANNSTVRVSVTGSPDFVVTVANGAFDWEMAIPLAAKSGTIAIHATDGKVSADGSFTIKGFADNRIQIAKVQGDNQSGPPGSLLPLSVRVRLADASNGPVSGAPVTFVASPGTLLSTAGVLSDASGEAEVFVRLPAAEGIAAITVNSSSVAQVPVTFYARAAGASLANVPKFVQAGDSLLGAGPATIAQKGALLTAVATILRYHQNRGELRAPNGAADPAALNQYLTQYCTVDTKGAQVCDGYLAAKGDGAEQVVNLWRAADFTGGVDVAAQAPTLAAVSDVLAQGSPALLSLALSRNGVPAGGHFVVAVGIGDDGGVLIQDPNPFFARPSLADYLRGFSAGGATWSGELRGVVQFALRSPSGTRFLVGAVSQSPAVMKALALDVQSVAGACGTPVELADAVDASGNASSGFVSRFQACDGAQAVYQVSLGAAQPFQAFLTDLATAGSTIDLSGGAAATYKVTRSRLNVVLAAQSASFTAEGVVNAASFTPGVSPGGIFSIFGAGLSGAGSATTVDFDGTAASVLLASPFQVNAVAPASLTPGTHTLRVRTPFGEAQQTVTVAAVAPGIFLIGNPPAGAVVNPDGSLNRTATPLLRGQYLSIYCTGLGAVTRQGNLSVATAPVTVVLNGHELPTLFAGLAPGFSGLYQVNVVVPAASPPALGGSLMLKQGNSVSNSVTVSVQ